MMAIRFLLSKLISIEGEHVFLYVVGNKIAAQENSFNGKKDANQIHVSSPRCLEKIYPPHNATAKYNSLYIHDLKIGSIYYFDGTNNTLVESEEMFQSKILVENAIVLSLYASLGDLRLQDHGIELGYSTCEEKQETAACTKEGEKSFVEGKEEKTACATCNKEESPGLIPPISKPESRVDTVNTSGKGKEEKTAFAPCTKGESTGLIPTILNPERRNETMITSGEVKQDVKAVTKKESGALISTVPENKSSDEFLDTFDEGKPDLTVCNEEESPRLTRSIHKTISFGKSVNTFAEGKEENSAVTVNNAALIPNTETIPDNCLAENEELEDPEVRNPPKDPVHNAEDQHADCHLQESVSKRTEGPEQDEVIPLKNESRGFLKLIIEKLQKVQLDGLDDNTLRDYVIRRLLKEQHLLKGGSVEVLFKGNYVVISFGKGEQEIIAYMENGKPTLTTRFPTITYTCSDQNSFLEGNDVRNACGDVFLSEDETTLVEWVEKEVCTRNGTLGQRLQNISLTISFGKSKCIVINHGDKKQMCTAKYVDGKLKWMCENPDLVGRCSLAIFEILWNEWLRDMFFLIIRKIKDSICGRINALIP